MSSLPDEYWAILRVLYRFFPEKSSSFNLDREKETKTFVIF